LEVLVSVDTDITVLASDPPGATISNIIPITAEGERFVKFITTPTPLSFTKSHWTPTGVGVGTLTAGFVAKKSTGLPLPLAGRCALAGADDRVVLPNLAVTTQLTDQVGDCSIQRTIDAQGCTVQIVLQSGCTEDTTITEESVAVGANTAIAIGCESRITATGSQKYCYPTTTAGLVKCITIP
jgi:hypothetical protein